MRREKSYSDSPSDSTHETSGIQSALRIELLFYAAHERQSISGVSPSIERRDSGGAMQNDERAAHTFQFCAQLLHRCMQANRGTIQPQPAESGRLDNGFPSDLAMGRDAPNRLDPIRNVCGKNREFHDGGGIQSAP